MCEGREGCRQPATRTIRMVEGPETPDERVYEIALCADCNDGPVATYVTAVHRVDRG